jgi:hypothetical protein
VCGVGEPSGTRTRHLEVAKVGVVVLAVAEHLDRLVVLVGLFR